MSCSHTPRPPQRSLFFLWGKVGAATRRPTPPQLGINKFTVSLKTTNVNSTSKVYVTFDTQFPFSSLGVCVENIQLCSFKGFSYRSLCTWLAFPDILWITKPRYTVLCVLSLFTLDNNSQMCQLFLVELAHKNIGCKLDLHLQGRQSWPSNLTCTFYFLCLSDDL